MFEGNAKGNAAFCPDLVRSFLGFFHLLQPWNRAGWFGDFAKRQSMEEEVLNSLSSPDVLLEKRQY